MKRLTMGVAALLAVTLTVLGAMSDSKAMSEAKKLWGNIAMISQERSATDSNWWRNIGVATPKCAGGVMRLGRGFNTWDAAFTDYQAHVTERKGMGPFSGTVKLQMDVFDNQSVAEAEFFIDGVGQGKQTWDQAAEYYWSTVELKMDLVTTLMTPGAHVICAQAKDRAGNVGIGGAWLFTVDQSAPPVASWDIDGPLFLAINGPDKNMCTDPHDTTTCIPDNRNPSFSVPRKQLSQLSPAVGVAECIPLVETDIRGIPRPSRPKDWYFIGDTGCDVGAYQVSGTVAFKWPVPYFFMRR